MKRIAMVMGLVALLPLLMGAGGSNPGIPFGTKIAGPTFNASVVLDPHEPGVTTTGKAASIRIYSNHNTAGAMFQIPVLFPLNFGCDLTWTDERFLHPLINWIPEGVLNALFSDLGTGRSAAFEPIITRIENDQCTADPANPGAIAPGFLSFQATIRFLVPKP